MNRLREKFGKSLYIGKFIVVDGFDAFYQPDREISLYKSATAPECALFESHMGLLLRFFVEIHT